jgi:hypothetical protein
MKDNKTAKKRNICSVHFDELFPAAKKEAKRRDMTLSGFVRHLIRKELGLFLDK